MLGSFSLFQKKKPFFFGETFGNQPFHSPPPGGVGIGPKEEAILWREFW